MYLVLKKDQSALTGWTPIVLSGADDPEEAALEGDPGNSTEVAVVEFDPLLFEVGQKRTVTPKTGEEE